jgi:hypothetical protein
MLISLRYIHCLIIFYTIVLIIKINWDFREITDIPDHVLYLWLRRAATDFTNDIDTRNIGNTTTFSTLRWSSSIKPIPSYTALIDFS